MTDFPDLKLKAQVNFPARVLDGTGIDIVKSNGSYQFNLAYDDFTPPALGLVDPLYQNVLIWNSVTGQYTLVPSGALAGQGAFLQAGSGAVPRTMQDKARDIVNVKDFGAVCDGVTPDDVAVTAAFVVAQANNLTVMFPPGTCLIATTTALNLTSGNVTIQGQGMGASIIKAANSAALVQLIASSATNKLTLKNITLDGNRTNNGTATTSSFGLYVATAGLLVDNVEVKNMQCYGIAFFNPASDAVITNSYFHDIGMTVSGANNIGVGIFAGSGNSMNNLTIANNRFINIFATALPIGDSAAINVGGVAFKIIGNYFRNNYNVGGGQCAISDHGSGAGKLDSIIQGNVCEQTGRQGTDSTAGFEVNGSYVSVIGNVIRGPIRGGVVIEAASTGCLVENNIIDGAVNDSGAFPAIDLINTVTRTIVRGNQIFNRAVGFRNQNGAGAFITLENNYFDTTVTTPILAGSIIAIRRNNIASGIDGFEGGSTFGSGLGSPSVSIDGSAAGSSGTGATLRFGNAGVFTAYMGYERAILGGTSDNLMVYQGSALLTLNLYSAGGLQFGHATAWIANGSVATTMTSLGPVGSHTTIQEWFKVTNSSGVVRYIPAY